MIILPATANARFTSNIKKKTKPRQTKIFEQQKHQTTNDEKKSFDPSRENFPPLRQPKNRWNNAPPTSNNTEDQDKAFKLLDEIDRLHSLCDVDRLLNRLTKINDALEKCKTEDEQLKVLLHGFK